MPPGTRWISNFLSKPRCQHTFQPGRSAPGRNLKTNGCYRPQYNPKDPKKTLIHPRYLKPEAGISFSHAIPAYSFVTLSVFSVFYNMRLYLPLYAVSFMRLSAFNPYIYFITDAYSASLILIFTSVLLCRHTPESRTQSFHPSVLLRRSVSKGRKVPTPLSQSPRPGQDADGFS